MKRTNIFLLIYSIIITISIIVVIDNRSRLKKEHTDKIVFYESALNSCESGFCSQLEEARLFVGILSHISLENMSETDLLSLFSKGNLSYLERIKGDTTFNAEFQLDYSYDYIYNVKSTSNYILMKDKKVLKVLCGWYDIADYELDWYLKNGCTLGND